MCPEAQFVAGPFLFSEEAPLQIDRLLRAFATLVGRALARRWLRRCDRSLPANNTPDRAEREVHETNEGTPGPEWPPDRD